MRSRKLIIEGERQEDFDRLAAGWRAEYEPEGQAAESLIERVILNDWMLRRAEGCYVDAEAELAEAEVLEKASEEIEAGHKKVQLYLRYKTTAERSFYRAFYALRGLRKDKVKEELDIEKFRGEIKRAMREEAEILMAEHEREQAEARETPLKPHKVGGSVKNGFTGRVDTSQGDRGGVSPCDGAAALGGSLSRRLLVSSERPATGASCADG